MGNIQTVSLFGLGAIGAAYGSKLHNHLGEKFTVIANKERMNRYNKGIKVDGEMYYFNCQTPDKQTSPRDLVIFAVKNDELKQAVQEAKYHIGPNTVILSLLNGISSENEIFKITQSKHILYSMCVSIDAVREYNEVRFSSLGKIVFGEKNQSYSNDVQAVETLFKEAEIPFEISENIWCTIWSKFMLNVGVNQVSAVLEASYDYFHQLPSLYQWMEDAMYEVVRVSEKVGVNLTGEDVINYRPIIRDLAADGKTSMLQDIEAKRKTEVAYFAGMVCELGEKYNIPTPINDQLYRMILIIEEMNALDTQKDLLNI